MKKSSNLNGVFEYELLDKSQQVIDLREKLAVLYATPFADILLWECREPSLFDSGYYKLLYYEQNVLKHIILFRYAAKAQKKIGVINWQFHIALKDVQNIAHILFNEFDKVRQITFDSIFKPEYKQSPNITFEKALDDVIIPLPESMDDYMKSLGKKTRRHIKVKMNLVASDFPGFEVQYVEKSDITFEQIEKIASLNRNRMNSLRIKSYLDDRECKSLYQYAITSGFGSLSICAIDGKMVGGYIIFIIGEHAYVYNGGYDISYSKYSMGQLALIYTIKYCIEKNVKYCHLLDSMHGYKLHLGGIVHDLCTLRVFRNKDIYYFLGKTKACFNKYKHRLKEDKTIYNFYIKLKKLTYR